MIFINKFIKFRIGLILNINVEGIVIVGLVIVKWYFKNEKFGGVDNVF